MDKPFVIDGVTFNKEYFKSIDEKRAVRELSAVYPFGTIMKAWKVANGFSVPKEITEEKPTTKKNRTTSEKKS